MTFDNGEKTKVISPKFTRTTTKYVLKSDPEIKLEKNTLASLGIYAGTFADLPTPTLRNRTNYSWVKVTIMFKNTGSLVIEDYKIIIRPEIEKIRDMKHELSSSGIPMLPMPHDPFYVFEKEKYGIYKRKDNAPLIQKDPKAIDFYLLIERNSIEIKIKCELLARDFNLEEDLLLKVEPTFARDLKTIKVDNEQDLKPDSIEIGDFFK